MSTFEPLPGTIPHRALAWLHSMHKCRPGYEPSTGEICEALDIMSGGFAAYMRPAREHGAVHTRKADIGKMLHWRLGDGTPDQGLQRHEREPAQPVQAPAIAPAPTPAPVSVFQLAPVPKFRALEFEGKLLVTGMEVRDGVAIFEPEEVMQLKAVTDWWRASA